MQSPCVSQCLNLNRLKSWLSRIFEDYLGIHQSHMIDSQLLSI